jgi:apolipoprotein N-acyltransferase
VIGHFRAEWFVLRFPWMTPGLALGPTWLSPWIGVYGAGFLLLLAAAHLATANFRVRLAGAVLTLGLAGLAVFRPPPVQETGTGIPLLMVQSENCDFETYRQMTNSAEFSDGIILWPEYAAPMFHEMPADRTAAAELVKTKRATLIFGTTRPIDATRRWNEALTLDESGEVGSHYKNRPVHFMADGVPGKQALPVATRFGRIGTPVCFDCDYVDTPRRMTAAGAQFFAVPSMDARHWSERQHLQHAELFRHRALENGRWMAVCATSGLTQVIDPHGNRWATLPLMEDAVMQSSVFRRDGLTFFTRIGWRLPQLLTAAWLIATLWIVGSLCRSSRSPAH